MRYRSLMFTVIGAVAVTLGCSGDKAPTTTEAEADAALAKRDSHPDYNDILGSWKIVSSEWDGDPNERAVGNFITFKNARMTAWIREIGDVTMDYDIDPTKEPKHLNAQAGMPPSQTLYSAIYQLDGDSLKVCFRERERPSGFKTERGSMWTSPVLQRSEAFE